MQYCTVLETTLANASKDIFTLQPLPDSFTSVKIRLSQPHHVKVMLAIISKAWSYQLRQQCYWVFENCFETTGYIRDLAVIVLA